MRRFEVLGEMVPLADLMHPSAQDRWRPWSEPVASRVAACERQLRALPRRLRRTLQRHFALSLAELALLLVLWSGPGWTATIPVDGTTCTLIDAITAANTDTITGGCPAGSGADALVLPAGGIFTLTTVDNTSEGAAGLPVVSSTITMAGQGSTIARDGGAPYFRLLTVAAGGDLTMRDLTLQGGIADDSRGGGVFNRGTLTLVNSTLAGNSAGLNGGGVFNLGILTLANSTLSGNTAYDGGGGVFNNYGVVTLVHCTLINNGAYSGGGVFNLGTLTIANSTLSGNSACCGGGAFNSDGTLAISNSTLSGNSALSDGGGVYNYGALTLTNSTLSGNSAGYNGGGVSTEYSSLTLVNSTLSGNSAGRYGGGVFGFESVLTLVNSSLSGNGAGYGGGGMDIRGFSALTLEQTLVSGNTAASGAEVYISEASSATVNSFNLFGHDNSSGVLGFDPGSSDIVPSQSLSAILNSILTIDGGPTPTHALVPGSPALDAVTSGSCPATDQRGFLRPSGVVCDIGAVESGASPPPVVNSPMSFLVLPETFSTTTDPTGCPDGFAGKFSFQAQLTNLDGSPSLLALKEAVVSLTNGNLLQTADGEPGGVAALQTLPQVGAFSDGILEPTDTMVVPMVICLQNLDQFLFEVDVLGLEQAPPP